MRRISWIWMKIQHYSAAADDENCSKGRLYSREILPKYRTAEKSFRRNLWRYRTQSLLFQDLRMLYSLGRILSEVYGPFRLLNSHLFLIVAGLSLGFIMTFSLLPRMFHFLPTDRGRDFAVESHASKGKPTGSGLFFIMFFIFISLLDRSSRTETAMDTLSCFSDDDFRVSRRHEHPSLERVSQRIGDLFSRLRHRLFCCMTERICGCPSQRLLSICRRSFSFPFRQ